MASARVRPKFSAPRVALGRPSVAAGKHRQPCEMTSADYAPTTDHTDQRPTPESYAAFACDWVDWWARAMAVYANIESGMMPSYLQQIVKVSEVCERVRISH